MIFWGLSKLFPDKRNKYHKTCEIFMLKSIEKMLQNPKNLTPEDPVLVFD